ncbi:MAG: MBL fold metallo-hydrolase [Actinobacteria bacterium]|nr:MBL fold metallo-hydrolase [Actinomycetota bacterium]
MTEPAAPVRRQEQEPAGDEILELAPGLYRLQLPISMPGLGHVNCYALEDEQGLALVDPGLPGEASWKVLVERLGQLGARIGHVHTVIVTHSHPDHFGGVHQLRDEAGATLLTHTDFRSIYGNDKAGGAAAELADLIEEPLADADESMDGVVEAFREEMRRATPWGTLREPPPMEEMRSWSGGGLGARAFQVPRPDRTVRDADEIQLGGRTWLAVHTPGHTHDHLCLYDPADGFFLAGDHILPTITPHIGGISELEDPLATFMDSLDRMDEFAAVSLVLPAHGHPFTDLSGRADAIRRHHGERLDVIREAGSEMGSATVDAFMQRLFKERSWGYMAASETYAHLEHLRLTGGAERTEEGGISSYLVA